ncbi:MAG: rod shape-determining protein MreC [Candidatus Paceibacterota bacterium]
MKITFLNWLKIAIAGAAGAGLIAVLNLPEVNSAVKNASYLALEPVQHGIWNAGASIHGFLEPFAKINSAASENEQLRTQVNGLLAENAQINDLKKENDFLRQGLNLELDKEFDLKLANIVAKDIARDTLVINKGRRDMIDLGMPVITAQKSLVGKVTDVYEDYSEVTLITSKDFTFDVRIGNGIDGLAKGQGEYLAELGLIPKDKEFKSGDPVYTSAMGGIFPAGLLVGSVDKISRNDVESFQSATLVLSFDARGSRQIFVASGKAPLGLESGAKKNNE